MILPSDYGNEKECGQGVARAIADGLVTRSDLFISSKLWNTFHEYDRVEPIVRKQLDWWGLEYFDLFHIHFPVAIKYVDPAVSYPSGWQDLDGNVKPIRVPIQKTWEALENLYDQGLFRSIGVSNFQGGLLLDVLRYARIPPAVLQVELHPYLVQQSLVELAKENGIALTAYSSFGPQSFLELAFKNAEDTPTLFDHPVIKKITDAHGKTPAQVLLRWSTQRGIAVVPKTNSKHRLPENLDVCSFDMTEDELQSISSLDRNLRFNNPRDYLGTLQIFA